MGMLGLIHRTVIGGGPKQFAKIFVTAPAPARINGRVALRNHGRQLLTHRRGAFLEIVRNSVLGLINNYKILPGYINDAPTVQLFQRRLQELLAKCVNPSSVRMIQLPTVRLEEPHKSKIRGLSTPDQ